MSWSVGYKDIYGKQMVESFKDKKSAQARYEELLPRTYGSLGDLESVSAPIASAVRESKECNWNDFADVVRRVMVGMEEAPRNASFRAETTNGTQTIRSTDGTPLVGICMDADSITITNIYMDVSDFDKAFDYCKKAADDLIATLPDADDVSVVRVDRNEDCGSSAASLGAVPTGGANKRNHAMLVEANSELDSIYGNGGIYTQESSADGFYPTKQNPMAWAIFNNDVKTLEALHDGTAPTPKNPWNCTGWNEDISAPEDVDGNYPYVYSMDDDYDATFVKDFHRVIAEKDNQDALRKVLEYYPDFILASIDFVNAFHKGYDKDLLEQFFNNIRSLVDDDSDLNMNYFGSDEFGDNPVKNLEDFFKEKN